MTSVSTGEAEERREKREEDSIILDYYNSKKQISSVSNGEEKKSTLLNRQAYTITSFYVTQEDIPILNEFRLTAKREAGPRAFSKVLTKAMAEYNNTHRAGNPQLLITNYSKSEGPQPIKVFCDLIRGALSDGRIFCRKPETWIPGVTCYSCEKNKLRKAEKK